MRILGIAGAILITLLLLTGRGLSSGVDLHSAEFAQEFLTVSEGQLQGRHHVESLREFMYRHYSSNFEVDAVYQMLLTQAQTEPRFKQECSQCHGTAAAFVRQSVYLRGGILLGRGSGQPTRVFLQQHRKLDANDIDFYTHLLNRVASEVYRP
jgi:hypothetical protein